MTENGAPTVLDIRNLSVAYRRGHDQVPAVDEVTLQIGRGEVVALVGESGSGKTTTAQAVLGLLSPNAVVTGGSIIHHADGRELDLVTASTRELRDLRGRRISLVPQDPTVSLNPLQRIGPQVEDVLRLHTDLSAEQRRQRVYELLGQVGFPDPPSRYRQYPHEISGGMRQRVLIAIAIALGPDLIVADEPTSGLDVTVQKRILDLLEELRVQHGTSVLLVTHDLGVASERAHRIVVLKNGAIVEQGSTSAVTSEPRAEYTRALIDAVPSISTAPVERRTVREDAPVVLSAKNLTKRFSLPGREDLLAVDNVSFELKKGQTLSIVGESGSGKSTTARILVRLVDPTSGTIEILGDDVTTLSRRQFRPYRRRIAIVYQNPYAALNPRFSIQDVIDEPLRSAGIRSRAARIERVAETLERVALPKSFAQRTPAELSGGQRQRVAIARALVSEPEIVVLDEPISALDVSVQAQILDLLEDLQQGLDLSYVLISHDLAVVRAVSDHVAVMQKGRIIEQGAVADIFGAPTSEYTRELIAAVPSLQPRSSLSVSTGV